MRYVLWYYGWEFLCGSINAVFPVTRWLGLTDGFAERDELHRSGTWREGDRIFYIQLGHLRIMLCKDWDRSPPVSISSIFQQARHAYEDAHAMEAEYLKQRQEWAAQKLHAA